MNPSKMFEPNVAGMHSRVQRTVRDVQFFARLFAEKVTDNWTDEAAVAAFRDFYLTPIGKSDGGTKYKGDSSFVSDLPRILQFKLGDMDMAAHQTLWKYFRTLREARQARKERRTSSMISRYLNNEYISFTLPDGSRRGFSARNSFRPMERAIEEWWPSLDKSMSFRPVLNGSHQEFGFHYFKVSPGLIKLRDERKLPFVATDRLILSFVKDGKHYVPEALEDDVPVEVLYAEKKLPFDVKSGFLVQHGAAYGVGSTVVNAKKAAKMKAVRMAKQVLGLD